MRQGVCGEPANLAELQFDQAIGRPPLAALELEEQREKARADGAGKARPGDARDCGARRESRLRSQK